MKARCEWCGIRVEVLSDGKCLLGHPVKRATRVTARAAQEPPPSRPPAVGITPARGRIRARMPVPARRPKAPTLGETPRLSTTATSMRPRPATASRPRVTDPPTTIVKIPTARPRPGDGPTQMPAGTRKPRPAASAKPAVRSPVAPKPVPRRPAAPVAKPGVANSGAAAPATSAAPAAAAEPKTPRPRPASRPVAPAAARAAAKQRKWVPLDPFGPSGPVEPVLEEPQPAKVIDLTSAQPSVRAPAPAPSPSPVPAPVAASWSAPASIGDALRNVDWRTGAERARDASLAGLRATSAALASAGAATARAGRSAWDTVSSVDYRGFARRLGPLSPQNPVMWVAGLAIAGIALLVGLRAPAPDQPQARVLGNRVVAAAELTEVPGYTIEDDPATEAEVAAQQPSARKVSAANVKDGEKLLARYQAITFGPEIRWTPERQKDWLALYARGAGIPENAFDERVVGRRSVWTAPLGEGQVAVLFFGSEVVVMVTSDASAAGDTIVDAVLSARGV